MEIRDARRYNMLVRVKEFGSKHADLFPVGSAGATTFAELGFLVDRLNSHAVSQSSGRTNAQKGAVGKAAARVALRDAVHAIVKMARGMAVANPEIGATFQRPVNRSERALVTRAEQFVISAAPFAAAFVSCGLPGTFVADLQGKLDAFGASSKAHTTAKQAHITARKDITVTVASALAALQQLDPIVEYRLGNDPGLLAAWRSARHVEQPARHSATPGAQPASAHPETPAAPMTLVAVKAA